ncbi:hypothetical protein [Nocardia sp. NBC_00511]|uniref:hypothetical protein n=1 Tax=Nocardia sp. NBC_00511 TaxID=2903591 RepID=UPI002F912B22
MTNRSRQAATLARLLTERTGRPVRQSYDGPRQARYGGWHLEWVDGPTIETMRALASEYIGRFPDLEVDEFRFSRSRTEFADAVALLLWLDTDLDAVLRYAPTFWFGGLAFERVEDPDRAPEVWQARARTLHALVDQAAERDTRISEPGPHRVVGEDLADHIRTDGWDATLQWLDSQAGPRTRHLRVVE